MDFEMLVKKFVKHIGPDAFYLFTDQEREEEEVGFSDEEWRYLKTLADNVETEVV